MFGLITKLAATFVGGIAVSVLYRNQGNILDHKLEDFDKPENKYFDFGPEVQELNLAIDEYTKILSEVKEGAK